MDLRTSIGYAIILIVLVNYIWMMTRQLRRMRTGRLVHTRFGYLRGYGGILYNMLETGYIASVSFFALHIGYVLTQNYRLENVRYGVIGISIGFMGLMIGRWLLMLLRIGPSYCGRLFAAGWVSILSTLLTLGVWVIVTTRGKVLEFRLPQAFSGLIIIVFISAVIFVLWLVLAYSRIE